MPRSGPTHHSVEDVAFLRALPNLTVVCPADVAEVRAALAAILKIDGPVYLRLGKKGEPVVHQEPPAMVIGRGLTVREGSDVCLLGLGNMVAPSLEAADSPGRPRHFGQGREHAHGQAARRGFAPRRAESFRRRGRGRRTQPHRRAGQRRGRMGRRTGVSRTKARLLSLGTPDLFLPESGSQKYLRQRFGLTPDAIAESVARCYQAERKV